MGGADGPESVTGAACAGRAGARTQCRKLDGRRWWRDLSGATGTASTINPVADAALAYHWSREEFVRAWEAGVFDQRVELVEGEVWPVVIGSWHGDTTARVARALPNDRATVTTASLPTGESLPDPDCWVRPVGAAPAGTVGARLLAWRPEDVLLVVEVADETATHDLGIKARLYGRAGYRVYWVITPDVIYEHTQPGPDGYRVRVEHRRGDQIAVGYADIELSVDTLVG